MLTNFTNSSFRYILLQANNFNLNSNINSQPYFYKILMSGLPNTYLYNTFVDATIYFNPPLKALSNFIFTFIDPNGNLINFNNQDHSFTLEITNINNFPENTNINTFTARL